MLVCVIPTSLRVCGMCRMSILAKEPFVFLFGKVGNKG
jgi:hypothetical protein